MTLCAEANNDIDRIQEESNTKGGGNREGNSDRGGEEDS